MGVVAMRGSRGRARANGKNRQQQGRQHGQCFRQPNQDTMFQHSESRLERKSKKVP